MPVPRASPATTAAGARSALPAAGRAATGHVQYGLPRRSAPSSRWRGLYRRGVPEFVVGYRHPTRRWPPSSTGGNLNSAGRFRTCQISSAADLGGVGLQRDGRLLVVRSRGRDRSSLPGGKFEDREPGTRAHPRGPRRTGPRPHPSAKCAHCAGVGPRPNRRHSAGLPRPHVSNAGRLQ